MIPSAIVALGVHEEGFFGGRCSSGKSAGVQDVVDLLVVIYCSAALHSATTSMRA